MGQRRECVRRTGDAEPLRRFGIELGTDLAGLVGGYDGVGRSGSKLGGKRLHQS